MKCGCYSHNGFVLRASDEGLAQREVSRREIHAMGLDPDAGQFYLDKVGSVSGLRRDERPSVFDDDLIDQQYRRFHNGS